MPQAFELTKSISSHAWNHDCSELAICPNTNRVYIYQKAGDDWKAKHVLSAHTMVIYGLDWHSTTNKIVSCSHDLNAFVWTYNSSKNKWEPSLSILRINRGALNVRWSPDGMKFAVASGAKTVPVCFYEENNNWWISNLIKKHKSTVLETAWHSSGQIIVTASSDFKCRVFKAHIKDIEKPAKTELGTMDSFGDLLVEFDPSKGWVEACTWSPKGSSLAFAGHDSSVSFVSFPGGKPVCQTLRTKNLPYTSIKFLNESVLVAAGHDLAPHVFQYEGKKWKFLGAIDGNSESRGRSDSKSKGRGRSRSKSKGKKKGTFADASNMWESKIQTGQSSGSSESIYNTIYTNLITSLEVYGNLKGNSFSSFSTTALDGKLVIWDKLAIQAVGSGLKL